MPTFEERLTEIEKVVAELKSKRFDWSAIAAYLPAARSLAWMLAGALAGGSGTYFTVPPTVEKVSVPGPERVIEKHKETVREVPVESPKGPDKGISKPGGKE